MKITLTQPNLAKALNYVSKAVSTKPNIPVLSNVLLEVSKNDLRLSATNLDMGIVMWIGGQVTTEGKVTASGKFLSDFVNATKGGKVEVSLENDTLNVITASSDASFQTIPATEFPILPKAEGKPFLSLPAKNLSEALSKVVFAASNDLATSKIQLTGVLFEMTEGDDKLTLVGTDGYRLSLKRLKVEKESKDAQQLIIPARSLQELVKVLDAEEVETVEMYLSESKSQVIFKQGDIEISIRLLEGPYPDYKSVVPAENAFSFEVDKGEFESAMKVVNTFARSVQGYRVDWDIDLESDTLVMRSQVTDLGVNETKLGVSEVQAPSDLRDAYSLQFLMEMVSHMQGDKIHFETNAPLSAAVFTDNKDKDYIHIVMPLQRN